MTGLWPTGWSPSLLETASGPAQLRRFIRLARYAASVAFTAIALRAGSATGGDEGVYSMDGDSAPLAEIQLCARRHHAAVG